VKFLCRRTQAIEASDVFDSLSQPLTVNGSFDLNPTIDYFDRVDWKLLVEEQSRVKNPLDNQDVFLAAALTLPA
jgi:hypothetical protein